MITMNTLTMFHVIFTLAIFIAFLGVVAWAFSARNKRAFDEAAQLPFADDRSENRP